MDTMNPPQTQSTRRGSRPFPIDGMPDGLMLEEDAPPQAAGDEAVGPVPAIRSALRPCFGVACACRSRCARYSAVDDSQADPDTLVTCVKGQAFPLFVDSSPPGRAACG
jgi:hypothetical protein